MFRRFNLLTKLSQRLTDSHQKVTFSSAISSFLTTETNPVNLDASHKGRFYAVQQEIYKTLPGTGGVTPEFDAQCKLFDEYYFLVRQPFLDLSKCIKSYDSKLPTMRYILYGIVGSGKTMTLACMVHYGYSADYVLFHVPWMTLWTKWTKEYVPSTTREDYIDHTTNAASWLTHFRTQNSKLLSKLNLKTTMEYSWSQREVTPQGSTLMEIIEHGIARPIHAAECMYALVKELKSLSSEGKCKTMVIIDSVNSMYYPCHKLRRPNKSIVEPNKITVFEAIRQFFKADWSGGVVVCSVDKLGVHSDFRKSDLPRYLLKKEGWEELDPFVPIKVENYSSQEVQTIIDYYLDRKWLQHPAAGTEEGRLELEYLSTRNPLTLMKLCNSK